MRERQRSPQTVACRHRPSSETPQPAQTRPDGRRLTAVPVCPGYVEPWPPVSEVFELTMFGVTLPLLLIAIMTFILITSSGTMAMAVKYGYEKKKNATFWLLVITAIFGATFVGMQAFEWTKLIVEEGVRPWGNPMGAAQFGSSFFMITGFHGLHVSGGVIYLSVVAWRVLSGFYDRKGTYETVEIAGLYWHFVDLVWVFIFAFFYLW